MVRWPWQRRAEAAHREAEEAHQERVTETEPLRRRAQAAIREAVEHRDDDFQAAIEGLFRRQP